ncbi:helix-turn-helix domain-containing protein, partial [Mesorhizobium sp. M00.F.Ca.ET.186.01.1.1]
SRARGASLESKKPMQIPITQQHIADTLGLSLVHTNKTIRKLMDRKLVLWRDGGCEVIDYDGLKSLARWEGLGEERRPLI